MKNVSLFRTLKMSQGRILEGVFAVNKPTGPSSAAILTDLQKQFNPSTIFAPWIQQEKANRSQESHNQRWRRREKKVQVKLGHGGTLDPLATGVLVTGLGKGTKRLQEYLDCTKEYEAIVVFGAATDTYDRVGKIVKRAPYEHVTKDLVEKKLEGFKGKSMQLPPLYSAIKMDGIPLYDYARKNKPLPRQIERREVDVLELELLEWMAPGTHEHKAPDEVANAAEMAFLTSEWKKADIAPGKSLIGKGSERDEKDRLELFERRKRKLSEDQDSLVKDAPPQKARRKSVEEDAVMSGGLPDPETTKEAKENEEVVASSPSKSPETESANPSVESKGPPAARIRMTVTSGFYVRSLVHELGAAVGSAACMAELQRTRQGEWKLGDNVLEYDDLMKGEEVWGPKIESILEDWEDRQREPRRQAILASKNAKGKDEPAAKEESKSEIKKESEATPGATSLKSEPSKVEVNSEVDFESLKKEIIEEVEVKGETTEITNDPPSSATIQGAEDSDKTAKAESA